MIICIHSFTKIPLPIEMANTEMEVEVKGDDKEMIKRIRGKIQEWGDFPYYYQVFNASEAPCFFSNQMHVALQEKYMETFYRVSEFHKSFDFLIGPRVVGCKVEPCRYSRLEEITCFSKDGHLRNTLSGRLFKGRIREGPEERQVIVKTWDFLLPRGHGYYHAQRPFKFCDEIELFIDENTNSHPNLAKLLTYCYEKRLAAVYDGTLTKVLSDVLLQDTFDWDKRVKVAIQLADLLSWLHDKGTAVGVVNGSCILIDEDANIKVFDFGYVFNPENEDEDSTELKKIPVGFDAPEAERGTRTMKCDVYPFGLLLLQLVTKREWEWEFNLGMDREDLKASILDMAENGKNCLVNECFEEVDYIAALQITNLIKLCTNIDPEGRPTMKVVLAKLRSLQKEDDKRKRDENRAEQNKKFSTGA